MTRSRLRVLLTSKSVWGAIFAAVAWLVQQPHIGVAAVVQALGMVLSAAGVRDAIAQAATGIAADPPKDGGGP